MLQVQAEVVERRFVGASQELRLLAPTLVAQMVPGQPVLVRASWGRDPFLRRPFYPIGIDGDTWTLRLPPGGDWGYAWLSTAPIGTTIDCLGPIGNGYVVPPGTHNLLCLGEEQASWYLLPLVEQAAAPSTLAGRQGGMAVTLACEALSERDVIPPTRLPPTVEVFLSTLDGGQGRHGRVDALLPEWLTWADAVVAAGSLPFYERLHTAAENARFRIERGFIQVLHHAPILCGTGACQACRVELVTGRRRACLRGPVFDLLDLRRSS